MPKNHKGEASVRRLTPGLRLTALVSVAATLIFASSRLAGAKTINANSASQSDVAAAIVSATDGDVVTVPGGTATWTHTLSVKKAIELRGAGVGSTIIKDNVQSGALILWNITGKTNARARLTGIEFQNGGRTSYYTGVVTVTGSNTNGSQFRMDHCKWGEDVNGSPLFDTVIGVVDHNTFIRRSDGGDGHCFWVFGYTLERKWFRRRFLVSANQFRQFAVFVFRGQHLHFYSSVFRFLYAMLTTEPGLCSGTIPLLASPSKIMEPKALVGGEEPERRSSTTTIVTERT